MKRLLFIGCLLCASGSMAQSQEKTNSPEIAISLPDGREVRPLGVHLEKESVVEGIRVLELEFPYTGSDGKQHRGERMRLYLPSANQPPLLVSIHYEMSLEDVESNIGIKTYIERGWAVLTPVDLSSEGMQNVFADNLEFSVASTHAAFKMPWIDPQRVCVAGGSAGGYQALIVTACTPGITAAVIWSPITHPIYLSEYFRKNQNVETPESISGWWETFEPSCEWLANRGLDSLKNRSICPTFIVDQITCPVLLSHSTADLIVPYCQVARERETLAIGNFSPAFVYSLDDVLPSSDSLQQTFFDSVPANAVECFTIRPVRDSNSESESEEEDIILLDLPFSKEKQYSFVTFDEGPINAATQGHFLNAFRYDCTRFLEYHFQRAEELKARKPTLQKN